MGTQTLERYTNTKPVNAFRMGKELEGIVNSNFDKGIILDACYLFENNNFYDPATRNDLKLNDEVWGYLLDLTSNVYTTGVALSEALSLMKNEVINKLKGHDEALQKKVLKSHDKRIPEEISHKKIGHNDDRNILDAVYNKYSDMLFPLDCKSTERHYNRAVDFFDYARNSEDKSEGALNYSMTLALDAANNIPVDPDDKNKFLKNQNNIIYDACSLAESLFVIEEAAKISKDMKLFFASYDADIKKIADGMIDKFEERYKSVSSGTERGFLEQFDNATYNLNIGDSEESFNKYLMHN